MGVRVRTATEDDAEAIGALAAAAFHPDTDVITRRLFPAHLQPTDGAPGDAVLRWRQARKAIKLADRRISMLVVVDDDLGGKIVGFALWEIPVRDATDGEVLSSAVSSPGLDQSAWDELQVVLDEDIRTNFGDQGTNNVWHLDYLAVDPGHQRRGIGKLLLDWGLDKARSDGRDCYLMATPAGRPLYERVGFVVLAELCIFGVPHYSMIRKGKQNNPN